MKMRCNFSKTLGLYQVSHAGPRDRSETGLSPRFSAGRGCNGLVSWAPSGSSERGPAAHGHLTGGLETPPSFAGQTLVGTRYATEKICQRKSQRPKTNRQRQWLVLTGDLRRFAHEAFLFLSVLSGSFFKAREGSR